jgi:hypothetical protein
MAAPVQVTVRRPDRLFYAGMAVVAAAIVFAGFSRTYFLKAYFGTGPLPPLVHLHGLLFTSWIALFFTQATLVAARRTDVHRRLGVAGGALAVLMIVVGFRVAVAAARRGASAPGGPPPLVFLVIPLGDILVFSMLVGAAFHFRRRVEIHKRLMVVATIGLLTAAIARLPFAFILATGPLAFFGLTDLVLVACVLYDSAVHRRVHPAYVWGGLLLVLSQPLRLAIAGTGAWLSFARWLTG